MRLHRELPALGERARYRKARYYQNLYRAAARLWGEGLDMSRAIEIVASAMNHNEG